MGPFHERVTQRIVYEKAAPKYTGAGFSRAPDMNVIRAGREERVAKPDEFLPSRFEQGPRNHFALDHVIAKCLERHVA